MSVISEPPDWLWQLFKRLRLRQFPLGPNDWSELRQALRAGFGWSSRESLRALCCTLWAKSRRDEEILVALFEQLFPLNEDWQLPTQKSTPPNKTATSVNRDKMLTVRDKMLTVIRSTIQRLKRLLYKVLKLVRERETKKTESKKSSEELLQIQPQRGLPSISLAGIQFSKRSFVFVPQFPLTYREVAQAWRRLHRPVRIGPPVEIDIEGTVTRRSQIGVASPIVLKPKRRNLARLLLLVDRQGSMNPFHAFIEEICDAIQHSARLNEVTVYYFHNVPVEGADETVLDSLEQQMFPVMDSVLSLIKPLVEGYLYEDGDLLSPQPLKTVLEEYAKDMAVVLLSDGGAARGYYSELRLLDTLAFLKALRLYTWQYVWLNPLPSRYWSGTTAAQIARHLPMFSLERDGIHRAVNVLRGHQYIVEQPL